MGADERWGGPRITRIVGPMEDSLLDVEADLDRIGALPLAERAEALEELERRLRALLDETPSA